MTIETIDHATLIKLADSGVVSNAHVVGQDGGWGLLVKYGTTERALATQRSRQARVFRKLETLVDYLRAVGIQRFDVDAANFDPHGATVSKRPDRSAAMKDAHAAAAYTKWLDTEVQEAIDDTSPTVEHDEAMRQIRAAIKHA
jgi:hypothetical protein